jgi:hypothetical protein
LREGNRKTEVLMIGISSTRCVRRDSCVCVVAGGALHVRDTELRETMRNLQPFIHCDSPRSEGVTFGQNGRLLEMADFCGSRRRPATREGDINLTSW